jgi:predicted O-methyltransferase YrrM
VDSPSGPQSIDLSAFTFDRRREPVQRAFAVVWLIATRALGFLPLRLRPSRQLAREAVHAGAMQKVGELAGLARMVRSERPSTVLEIGSFIGGTLGLFCKLAEADALLVSVDLPSNYGGATVAELEALARANQRVVAVRRDSHADETRAEVEQLLAGRQVDVLMIDGDHSYEGVRRDFELYAPLVRPAGLIAFHDIVPHVRIPEIEVERLWAELRDGYEHVEIVESGRESGFGPWGGIGVLRQRAPVGPAAAATD